MYLNKRGSTKAKGLYLALLILAVLLQAIGAVVMKQVALTAGTLWDITENPLLYLVVVIIFSRAIIWPLILHHIELSVANSVSAIVPVLLLAAGYLFYQEAINWNHLLGGIMVTVGIWFLVAGSSQ